MNVVKTDIDGVLVLEPRVFSDERGYFFESFSEREFVEKIGPVHFVQDNESRSVFGVVRGLHFQMPPHAQAKLVRCVRGRVLDVAVDLRKGSPSFGKSVAVEISESNHRQLFIPKGFAHGFSVLSPEAVFQYKCDAYYEPSSEAGISLFDESLGIDWRIDHGQIIASSKDRSRPLLKDYETPFEFGKI